MKTISTIMLVWVAMHCAAQNQNDSTTQTPETQKVKPAYHKNEFKINTTSLLLGNVSLWYERSVTSKISLSVGYSTMSNTRLDGTPIGKSVLKKVLDGNDNIAGTQVSNHTYTGEIRFYCGRKPGPRGFYISLYGRQTKLDAVYPYSYNTGSKNYNIPLTGGFSGFAGGFGFGSKWIIAKRVSIDLYLVGAHYGHLSGSFTGAANLSTASTADKNAIASDISNVISGDFNVIKDVVVTNSGVTGNLDGKLIGTMMGSLKIGIAF